ncbi:hypothetical protein Tco_1539304 [Tanacetum coccineum]
MNTEIPLSSGPTEHVADEVVYKERGDSLVRAATTASSLEVEQDSGNIDKTQSKAILNEPSSPRISSEQEVAANKENDEVNFVEEKTFKRQSWKKTKEVNIALIETWDDIQEKIDVDHQLAERIKAQEQEELSIKEKATLYQQL